MFIQTSKYISLFPLKQGVEYTMIQSTFPCKAGRNLLIVMIKKYKDDDATDVILISYFPMVLNRYNDIQRWMVANKYDESYQQI